MAATLLEVRELGKRFAQREGRDPSPWVIKDLSFSVRAGEFLTIVGPSGAGKSTLLNIIAQIDTASAGEIACHPARAAATAQNRRASRSSWPAVACRPRSGAWERRSVWTRAKVCLVTTAG